MMREVPPHMIGKAIGARIRELRLDAELTQEQLAFLVGTHRPIVGRVENGRHVITIETVACYAAALGLEMGDLLVALDITWPTTAKLFEAAA